MIPSCQACSTHLCSVAYATRRCSWPVTQRGDVLMAHPCDKPIDATIGIDVSKDQLDVVLRREQREQARTCANTSAGFGELQRWLLTQQVQPERTQLALEATGSYSDAISQFLYEQGYLVSVLNPAVLVAYRKSVNMRSKTDALDARLLARYAWEYRPATWKPLP